MEVVERRQKMSFFVAKETLISPGHPALSLVTVQHQSVGLNTCDCVLKVLRVTFEVAE